MLKEQEKEGKVLVDISLYYITELKFSLEYTKIYKIYKTRLMYLYILIHINICTCLRYLYKPIHIINMM